MDKTDQYNLIRFINAQESIYESALLELRQGKKRTHWMWFIFPQLDGLSYSAMSRFYSIKSKAEAIAYLDHPVLGARLTECAQALLELEGRSASDIFDPPDDQKFWSCMTLFACVSETVNVFYRILEKYFDGEKDNKTVYLLSYRVN